MNVKGRSITQGCTFFKKSRQGYYERNQSGLKRCQFKQLVLDKVKKIRTLLPQCGTRKLVYMLKQEGIVIGRDRLFTLLREEKLLIKRKIRHVKTTDSKPGSNRYDNLLKELEINHAEEIFVSDITDIRTREGFCYLAIVADAYSKKIMGKFVSRDIKSPLVIKALLESLRNRRYQGSLIHHSDQGSVYTSRLYTNALKLFQITISMASRGKAWENAVMERIIGILKQELGLNQIFETYQEADEYIDKAIILYNTIRPHLSCGYLTPQQAHEQGCNLVNVWRAKLSTYPQKEERKKEAKKERRKTTTTTTIANNTLTVKYI